MSWVIGGLVDKIEGFTWAENRLHQRTMMVVPWA